MPRRVSRRRLVVAALLVALSVLPNVVHLYAGIEYHPQPDVFYLPTPERNPPAVMVHAFDRVWSHVKAPSKERARGGAYRWEQYRRLWWIPAGLAACLVIWPFLSFRAIFSADDE